MEPASSSGDLRVAAGWYPDPQTGQQRWWDGKQWGPYAPPQPPAMYAPVQPNVRQAMDRAQYVRQQKGHSILLHLLLGWVLLYIPTVYYAISPNHYFHV
jgi:hypothetical protein